MTGSHDELLQPTLQSHPSDQRRAPWRLQSQLWVWFFGGALGGGAIAWWNARRLGLTRPVQVGIVVVAVVALAVQLAIVYLFFRSRGDADAGNVLRFVSRVAALAGGFGCNRLMRDADRTFQALDPRKYSSLWLTGFVAIVLALLLQLVGGTYLVAWLIR